MLTRKMPRKFGAVYRSPNRNNHPQGLAQPRDRVRRRPTGSASHFRPGVVQLIGGDLGRVWNPQCWRQDPVRTSARQPKSAFFATAPHVGLAQRTVIARDPHTDRPPPELLVSFRHTNPVRLVAVAPPCPGSALSGMKTGSRRGSKTLPHVRLPTSSPFLHLVVPCARHTR